MAVLEKMSPRWTRLNQYRKKTSSTKFEKNRTTLLCLCSSLEIFCVSRLSTCGFLSACRSGVSVLTPSASASILGLKRGPLWILEMLYTILLWAKGAKMIMFSPPLNLPFAQMPSVRKRCPDSHSAIRAVQRLTDFWLLAVTSSANNLFSMRNVGKDFRLI